MEENKDVQSSKGKKKGNLLKLIIALVVIGAIAAVVVLGAQGGWFQGSMFRTKLKTVAPIEKTVEVKRDVVIEKEILSPITKLEPKKSVTQEFDKPITREPVLEEEPIVFAPMTQEATMVTTPPHVEFAYLDKPNLYSHTIYQKQDPKSDNIVLVFRLNNTGGEAFKLSNLVLNHAGHSFSSCGLPLIASKYDRCNVNNFSFGKSGTLFRLDANDKQTNVGYGDPATGRFTLNTTYSEVQPGESAVFIVRTNVQGIISSWDADNITGKTFVLTEELEFLDANGQKLESGSGYFSGAADSVTPQSIEFR